MQVDHDIFHLGIIDGALGGGAPGFLRCREAVEQTDEVDLVEVDEFQALRILDPPAEYQVKLAHDLQKRQAELASLIEQRDQLRHRSALLNPKKADPDLADEMVRKDLGLVRSDEVILPLN